MQNLDPLAASPSGAAVPPAETVADPWASLRRFTAARIALGRAGGSLPTAARLSFQLAHARARDAVKTDLDVSALVAPLEQAGLPTFPLSSAVSDRQQYLLRPDLGRQLSPESRQTLQALAAAPDFASPDLAIIVSDGLAAAAAQNHAAATLLPLIAELHAAGWRLGPVFVVPLARVKIQDEIGSLLDARFSLMLLGERPGLGTPDSLGAYFTAAPAPERTDADRNCVSNIRPDGLPPAGAAAKLAWLLRESARTGRSGVQLKDDQQPGASIP